MGRPVVTLGWEGGSPGHSGSVVIRASRRGFIVDDEVDSYVPFGTLDEALALNTFHLGDTPGPVLICSPEVAGSAALMAAALDLAGSSGGEVCINGVRHVRTAEGELRRR